MTKMLTCLALLLAAPAAASQITAPDGPGEHTIINDSAAMRRLLHNSGITLQWIGFETPARGHVRVFELNGQYRLTGSQAARRGGGRVTVDGVVLAIDARSFTFRGRIVITDTPDPGRNCVRDGTYEFRATGTRRYWRLQQMEACDGLTDYVDIYF